MNTHQVTILQREICAHVYAVRGNRIMRQYRRRWFAAELRSFAEEFGELMLPAVLAAGVVFGALVIFA